MAGKDDFLVRIVTLAELDDAAVDFLVRIVPFDELEDAARPPPRRFQVRCEATCLRQSLNQSSTRRTCSLRAWLNARFESGDKGS